MERSLSNDIISTAESFCNNFYEKGDFDFSFRSLEEVDDLLEDLLDEELDEEDISAISSMVGCYIFEVARKKYGGEYSWSEEKQQPILITGEPDFHISLYAFEKVKERVINGQENNISKCLLALFKTI